MFKTHSVIETTTGIDNKNAEASRLITAEVDFILGTRTTKLAKVTDFKFYCAFIIIENMKVILIK